ncbi:MAG: hypothetical protein JXL97_14730 [Bacteroidales bacterium]|nr:hypothetical protein [Bacteroidales bacterium]
MEHNSTIFFKIDDFNLNYEIMTISDFNEIDNELNEIFLKPAVFCPSDEVIRSLIEKLYSVNN